MRLPLRLISDQRRRYFVLAMEISFDSQCEKTWQAFARRAVRTVFKIPNLASARELPFTIV
ncbi:hypothetical protein [Caballeronia sp. BR00000012568055]|uniref:hypothetical protein n=1 Tax=Caballeronia sp. BR00000012568055 TaxID=2918761 RepID=UPI0023F9427C|nr:hypothetical protein [Caballeronia sp. BR00000012568055]